MISDEPVNPAPCELRAAFEQGLNDIEHGRIVDGDDVIAEGRAMLARHRAAKAIDLDRSVPARRSR